jgi:hypothetical protein
MLDAGGRQIVLASLSSQTPGLLRPLLQHPVHALNVPGSGSARFGVFAPAPWPPTQRRLVDRLPGHRPPLPSPAPSPAAPPTLATPASSSPRAPSCSPRAAGRGCACLCVSEVARLRKTGDGCRGQDASATDLISFIRVLLCGCVWFCFACTAGWYDRFKAGFLMAHVEANRCLCPSLCPSLCP